MHKQTLRKARWGVWAIWPIGTSLCLLLLMIPGAAFAHGPVSDEYRTTIISVEPKGLPIEISIVDGDEVRFENKGDQTLAVCGYEPEGCEPWVRIEPGDGVYEDRNAKAFWFNQEDDRFGDVPEGVGEGGPEWVRVRRAPAFYKYHDHRVHWMAKDTLPPGIDPGDPSPQHVFDGKVSFRYGDTDGVMTARLEYVGGQTWFQRYGEYLITGTGIAAMLAVFVVDRRRRRRAAAHGEAGEAPSTDVDADGVAVGAGASDQ